MFNSLNFPNLKKQIEYQLGFQDLELSIFEENVSCN